MNINEFEKFYATVFFFNYIFFILVSEVLWELQSTNNMLIIYCFSGWHEGYSLA